jgi:methionyl aminopeptidase
LDSIAAEMMKKFGGTPAFKGYKPDEYTPPFASIICASVNEAIVHTPASEDVILKEGDIISVDIGMVYKGCYTDMARTVPVGKISQEVQQLLEVTKESLHRGIETVKAGNSVYDIGKAIQDYVQPYGYGIIRDLVGHGVGVEVHEEPPIPNYASRAMKKIILEEGMVIAIEPMLTLGGHDIEVLDDQWTIVTADRRWAAHFEHTVIVTKSGYDIATI